MASHFDLTDIRLFVNIAETNSLTHGAERSCLSVPAASTRIRNVEDSLKAQLLYRSSQGVTLTPPGHTFLQHGRLVLHEVERLSAELSEYAEGIKGHVRILANTTAITEFLPGVLRTFLASHPQVNIDLRERLSDHIVRAVSEGTTDIGIVAGDVRTEGLQVLPYRQDSLVLATSLTHPLAARPSVSFDETLDFDYIGLSEASAIHAFLDRASRHCHKRLKIRIEVGNFEAVCRMIEANIGIGVLPQSAAERHARTLAIRIVPLNNGWAARNLQICVRDVELLSTFSRELVDLLTSDAAILQDSVDAAVST